MIAAKVYGGNSLFKFLIFNLLFCCQLPNVVLSLIKQLACINKELILICSVNMEMGFRNCFWKVFVVNVTDCWLGSGNKWCQTSHER